jgi:hypothetical protein
MIDGCRPRSVLSSNSTLGSLASALAIAISCCCPPDRLTAGSASLQHWEQLIDIVAPVESSRAGETGFTFFTVIVEKTASLVQNRCRWRPADISSSWLIGVVQFDSTEWSELVPDQ